MRRSAYSAIRCPQIPAALTTIPAYRVRAREVGGRIPDAADAIAPAQQACYFAAGKDLRAVFAGVEHIGRGEAKRVDGTVRDLHRAQQRRVDGGLPAQRFLRRERRGLYASLLTGVDKGLLPCGSSSGRVINSPLVGSIQWRAMRRRMRFSLMHSRADSLSVTA